MNNNIFLPDKIKVGYQNRQDTYTGKLAYVIYYDQKGVLRKEKSWSGWRDHKIDANDYTNEPTSGFVLNKKVGGYSNGWDHRQTYVRVFDPRGFEFEISVPNLLYILANTSSIIGKGLEGDFVYGWEGTELLLIPTNSPDYKTLSEYNNKLKSGNKYKGTDLIAGATYQTKNNNNLVYMGRFEAYSDNSWDETFGKPLGKKYFFYGKEDRWENFRTVTSVGSLIIGTVSETPVDNYAALMDKLETHFMYSPYDSSKDEKLYIEANELIENINSGRSTYYSYHKFFTDYFGKSSPHVYIHKAKFKLKNPHYLGYYGNKGDPYPPNTYYATSGNGSHYSNDIPNPDDFVGSMDEIVQKFKPYVKKMYLQNGKFIKKGIEI